MEWLYASHPPLEIITFFAAVYVAACGRMIVRNKMEKIFHERLLTILR
jgi:hypothetical protein